MLIEEIQGYHKFIERCPDIGKIFLNEYFRIIQHNLDNPHTKDKSRPGAYDWHHIIPQSMSGHDSPLVLLEFKDHVLVHFFLFKAFRNEEMAYAFNMLSNRESATDFENFSEEDREELLVSLQHAKEIFGKRRSLMATEFMSTKNPNKGKFGESHHCYGKIIINDGGNRCIRVAQDVYETVYAPDGWKIGLPSRVIEKMKGRKKGYIKINNSIDEKTIPESDLNIFLSTGWEIGRLSEISSALVGKCRYATPDGIFYQMLSHTDPVIAELGLIKHKTEAVTRSALMAQKLAVMANSGTTVYNNGTIQKRFKEHPGEGWILGELPLSEEIKKKRGDACSVACKGTIIYNDGVRNYRLKPEEEPEPHWVKGMAPQKKRSSTNQKGLVVYNDGWRNYRISPDQVPDPSWKRGMKPR